MHKAFSETVQRPFPLPSKPWVMTQMWENLLFSHWPIPLDIIRKHVPPSLKMDLYQGSAWLGVIPFYVNHMKLRGVPEIPYLRSYIELNVRTYVTYQGKPGIYFFRLDANKWPAVIGGRIVAFLPYRLAQMNMKITDNKIYFQSESQNPSGSKKVLNLTYSSTSKAYLPPQNSLEYWLFERYCFFTARGNHLYRGDIHHDRWRVCSAEAMVHTNTIASFLPHSFFESSPLVHFTAQKKVFIWPLNKLT
ncbi:YqjF family protein [Bacillus sp. FSL K6-3431]|uniref:YqjF family protein n=1 Tax=Bacillus sp. FSL K6-3431 TaxID=2921500 RepID=UPI0030F56DC4